MKKVVKLNQKDMEALVKRIIKESVGEGSDEWHPSWTGEMPPEEEYLSAKKSIKSMLEKLIHTIETSGYTEDDVNYLFHVEQTLIDLKYEIGL
jgi:hypothetical protein